MENKKLEFVKLEIGKTISGTIEGFGKNRYGVFLILKSGKKNLAINLKPTVLRNLIKTNLKEFNKGNKVEITKVEKAKGKSYFIYDVSVNDKLLQSRSYDLDINDVESLL